MNGILAAQFVESQVSGAYGGSSVGKAYEVVDVETALQEAFLQGRNLPFSGGDRMLCHP